jgi:hypothetical protein
VDLLRPEAGTINKSDLREKSTCLSDLLSLVPRLEAVGYELKQRVETTFGLSLAEGELAGDEETLANERALAKRRNTSAMEHAVSKRSDSDVPGRMLASARFLK